MIVWYKNNKNNENKVEIKNQQETKSTIVKVKEIDKRIKGKSMKKERKHKNKVERWDNKRKNEKRIKVSQ